MAAKVWVTLNETETEWCDECALPSRFVITGTALSSRGVERLRADRCDRCYEAPT